LTYQTKKQPLSPKELHDIVESDRYPFSLSRSHLRCSPRIRTLRGTLAKLRPEPVGEGLSFAQASIPKGSTQPLPPPKVYGYREPPQPDGAALVGSRVKGEAFLISPNSSDG
jgi:hypothetical protein